MSKQFLLHLNNNRSGLLKEFIDQFEGKEEPRIAWYPSAHSDFRPMLYLQQKYLDHFPEYNNLEPKAPDIFLYTDIMAHEIFYPNFFERFNPVLISEIGTTVKIIEREELDSLHFKIHPKIVAFSDVKENTNKVLFLKLKITSNRKWMGRYNYHTGNSEFFTYLIYAFTENEGFCARRLLRFNAKVSHIVHVRYGFSLGGAKNCGAWIIKLLKRLNCEVFIADNHIIATESNVDAIRIYPQLASEENVVLSEYKRMDNSKWQSAYGDVTFSLVS